GEKRLDLVVGVNPVNRNGDFLPAAAGIGHVDVAVVVDGGVGHRMQAFRDGLGDLEFAAVAPVSIAVDGYVTGLRTIRHSRNHKVFRAYNDGAAHAAEAH